MSLRCRTPPCDPTLRLSHACIVSTKNRSPILNGLVPMRRSSRPRRSQSPLHQIPATPCRYYPRFGRAGRKSAWLLGFGDVPKTAPTLTSPEAPSSGHVRSMWRGRGRWGEEGPEMALALGIKRHRMASFPACCRLSTTANLRLSSSRRPSWRAQSFCRWWPPACLVAAWYPRFQPDRPRSTIRIRLSMRAFALCSGSQTSRRATIRMGTCPASSDGRRIRPALEPSCARPEYAPTTG